MMMLDIIPVERKRGFPVAVVLLILSAPVAFALGLSAALSAVLCAVSLSQP